MKNTTVFITAILFTLFLSGCTTTFAGTLFLITVKDVVYYILISFILALLIAYSSENKKRAFWIWFILGLVLSPLAGFIYLLVKISKRIS